MKFPKIRYTESKKNNKGGTKIMRTFEEKIDINIYKLHEELRFQPNLYFEYAKPYAQSVADSKRKEEQLKLLKTEVKAELEIAKSSMDLEIRSNPEKFGAKKHTETAIKSIISNSKELQELNKTLNDKLEKKTEEYIQAVEEMEVLLASVNAINHRRTSLENEVKLLLGGMYSEPKIKKENKEEIKNKADRKRKSAMTNLKKRKKE